MGAGCHRKDKRSFRAMRGSWSRTSSARGDIMQTSVSEAIVPARRPQPARTRQLPELHDGTPHAARQREKRRIGSRHFLKNCWKV